MGELFEMSLLKEIEPLKTKDFLKGKFPSGTVSQNKLIKGEVQMKLKSNFTIGFIGKYFFKINSHRIESFLFANLNF